MVVENLSVVAFVGQRDRRGVVDALLDLTADPVEFLHAEVFPDGVVAVGEGLGSLIVVREGAWLLQDVVFGLVLDLGQLVHVLRATVVLLGLGVADGLVKALTEGLVVRAFLSEPLVVALEALNALNSLELGLEVVLNLLGQTAEVVINLGLKVL